ncbi:MAG TPA: class E sortase [Acidimicrobiales bacterium]
MTPAPPAPAPARRLRRRGVVALVAAAALGLTGWSLTAGTANDATVAVATTATTAPPPPAPATTVPPPTTAAPVDLPIPEDAPVDPYAPTPHVVHGTLALPRIGVSQPLHEGITLTAIDKGPSHWPGTALPGEPGNVVVAGHRTTHTRPFHDLDLLQPGDPLVFTMGDGTVWTYEHTGTEIVGPDATYIAIQTAERTATLFACHPKGSAAQRIVAHFRLVGGDGAT